jgi:hypothetical protein
MMRSGIFMLPVDGVLDMNAFLARLLYVYVKKGEEASVVIAASAGALFVSIAGPCITWKPIRSGKKSKTGIT